MPENTRVAGAAMAALLIVTVCVVGFTHRDTVMQSLFEDQPMTGEAAVFAMADSSATQGHKAEMTQLKAAAWTGAPRDNGRAFGTGTAAPESLAAVPVPNFAKPAWNYEVGRSSTGPDSWADRYNKAGGKGFCDGKKQSPIDIDTQRNLRMHVVNKLKLDWKMWRPNGDMVQMINTGWTMQIQGAGLETSVTTFEDKAYKMKNIRFYQPSEHSINGEHYPLEMRFVHQAADGAYMELGLLFHEDAQHVSSRLWGKEPCYECNDNYFMNMSLNWMDLPKKAGTQQQLKYGFNLLDMMPDDLNYFTYDGSFSAPPCTEGVKYVVLLPHKEIFVSPRQVAAFPFHGNNRPTQPLNGRKVDYLSAVKGQYVTPVYSADGFFGTAAPAVEPYAYEGGVENPIVQEHIMDDGLHKVFRDLGKVRVVKKNRRTGQQEQVGYKP
jgi:carbonic anhydrase